MSPKAKNFGAASAKFDNLVESNGDNCSGNWGSGEERAALKTGSSDARRSHGRKFQEIIRQKNKILNSLWCGGKAENRKFDIERVLVPNCPSNHVRNMMLSNISLNEEELFWGNRHELDEDRDKK